MKKFRAVVDTGGVYALFDRRDDHHEATVAILERLSRPLWLPAPVLGELDYLLGLLGNSAHRDLLAAIQRGFFRLHQPTPAEIQRADQLLTQYADLRLGLTDALVMAAAEALKIPHIVTVAQRHFRAVSSRIGPFRLLPIDGVE